MGEKQEKVLEMLRGGADREFAAGAAGVSDAEFVSWMEGEFRLEVERAEDAAAERPALRCRREGILGRLQRRIRRLQRRISPPAKDK
jgi:hypothetical protein